MDIGTSADSSRWVFSQSPTSNVQTAGSVEAIPAHVQTVANIEAIPAHVQTAASIEAIPVQVHTCSFEIDMGAEVQKLPSEVLPLLVPLVLLLPVLMLAQVLGSP